MYSFEINSYKIEDLYTEEIREIREIRKIKYGKVKIKEYIFKGQGVSGNAQRNYALTKITNQDTLLYYLDDDNIIHPNMYRLLNIIDNDKMYSFNQYIK